MANRRVNLDVVRVFRSPRLPLALSLCAVFAPLDHNGSKLVAGPTYEYALLCLTWLLATRLITSSRGKDAPRVIGNKSQISKPQNRSCQLTLTVKVCKYHSQASELFRESSFTAFKSWYWQWYRHQELRQCNFYLSLKYVIYVYPLTSGKEKFISWL